MENQQPFTIQTQEQLGWAMRKLAEIREKKAKNDAYAQAEIGRIEQWMQEVNKPLDDEDSYFASLIQDYHFRELMRDPKAKTLSTPWGKSKSRTSKAQPDAIDKKALLEYVQQNGMTEFIKHDVKWADLKKTLRIHEEQVYDENGQPVPGVVVKPESITYSVDVGV